MPPNISFDHSNIYYNTALNPTPTTSNVDQPTSIAVTLRNAGNHAGTALVKLWFGCNNAGAGGWAWDRLWPLAAPYDAPDGSPDAAGKELFITVPAADPQAGILFGEASQTVVWTPDASDFATGSGTTHGCLFAKAFVQPIGDEDGDGFPDYAGASPAGDGTVYDPTDALCAQHNTDVVALATKSAKKPLFYAFGFGHGLKKEVGARLRIEKLTDRVPGLAERIRRVHKELKTPATGRLLTANNVTAALGAERLWFRQRLTKRGLAPRFGHAGQLPAEIGKQLAAGRFATQLKAGLAPGELRQGILQITPPPGAKPGDSFVIGIVNEVPAPRPASGKARPARVLGTLTVIVHIV